MSEYLKGYREQPLEKLRVANLLEIIPKNHESILDIGTRDGFIAQRLTEIFPKVTALDLVKPQLDSKTIECIQGDVTKLDFPDNHFEIVLCAEVLEHVPKLEQACLELARVAANSIVIGVPFEQDLRIGKTTCRDCGNINPPWGHVNSFTKSRLIQLFPTCELTKCEFIGERKRTTNKAASMLQTWAGNPWGTYDQEEPCIYCGSQICRPPNKSLVSRVLSKAGVIIERIPTSLFKSKPTWIHMVFQKRK